jgi:hypothetical protein
LIESSLGGCIITKYRKTHNRLLEMVPRQMADRAGELVFIALW